MIGTNLRDSDDIRQRASEADRANRGEDELFVRDRAAEPALDAAGEVSLVCGTNVEVVIPIGSLVALQ